MRRAWRAFVQSPLTVLAIAVGAYVLLLLGKTWRVRYVGRRHADAARLGGGPVLYALLHGVLLPLTFAHRGRDVRLLVSQSRDGEILARVAGRLGYGAVRGSSTRGAERAVVRMAALARAGHDLGVTPDGPRGPRGSVSPGTALISARGDVPILPVGAASRPAWRAASWDRFLVPPPFARVWVVYGPTIRAAGRDRSEVDREIGAAIAAVEEAALALAAGTAVPGDSSRVPA